MKEGDQESRNTEPLFPRLHVNDREKGGPRAPPRNKMALYEQFSIPSQRFNSSPASTPCKGATLRSFASSGQTHGHERDAFTVSNIPSQLSTVSNIPSQLSIRGDKMVYSQSVETVSFDSGIEIVRFSKKRAVNSIFNANRSANNSVRPSDSSIANKSQHKNFDNSDDFMVPTFVQSRIALSPNKNPSIMGSESSSTLCAGNREKISSSASPDSSDRHSKVTYLNNTGSKTAKHDHVDKAHGGVLIVKDPKRVPDSGGRFPKFAKPLSIQGDAGTATVVVASSCNNERVHPRKCSNGAINGARCYIGVDIINERENLRVRKLSGFSLCSSQCASKEADELDQSEHRAKGPLEVGDVDKNEDSEASLPGPPPEVSLPGSVSSMAICPDNVVGVIGPKHFWKARRAIVNQQRIFAIQVFELHRLIKVQRLLAASPDVLKVDAYLTKSPSRVSMTVIPTGDVEKSHQLTMTREVPSKTPNAIADCSEVSTIQGPPASQNLINGANQAPSRSNPWSLHPHQNQWLFPVMSPSEGLIYKPYAGPCPSTSGFLPPFYGSYVPVSFPPIPVDFMNPAYHAPPQHRQPQFCFPSPYSLPVPRPIMSSVAEQVTPLVGLQPNVQDFQQPRSSCDVMNATCDIISGPGQSSQASKVGEMQGSALTTQEDAQSAKKNTLPLFPASQNSNGTSESSPLESANEKDQNRVIRVVPHTPTLATESAARILRFIQEERRQYDS